MGAPTEEDEEERQAVQKAEAEEFLTKAMAELESSEVWDTHTVRDLELVLDEVAAAFINVVKLYDPEWEGDKQLERDFFGWLDAHNPKGAKLSPLIEKILAFTAQGRYGEELVDADVVEADKLRLDVWDALEKAKEEHPWTP